MERFIFRSDWYGLDGPKDWKRLGDIPVTLKVDVWSDPGNAIYRLPIRKRWAWMNQRIRRLREELIEALDLDVIPGASPTRYPRKLKIRIAARRVPALSRRPEVNSLEVLRIPGHRRRKPPKPLSYDWFSVRARFAILVEGRNGGVKEWEDRIVLLKATSYQDAERRALREFKEYESSCLNTELRRVHWRYERVEEIFKTFIDTVDPAGTEVWSSLHRGR